MLGSRKHKVVVSKLFKKKQDNKTNHYLKKSLILKMIKKGKKTLFKNQSKQKY